MAALKAEHADAPVSTDALAAELGDYRPTTQAAPEVTRRAMELRNRIATLLTDRIALVRAATRFVFRNDPDIARQSGSAYDRRRRAALRRQADAERPQTTVGQASATTIA